MKTVDLIEDRIFRGGIAGVVSGIIVLIFNLSVKALGLTSIIWIDFADVFVHGEPTTGTIPTIFSIFVLFILEGALGALFSYLVPTLSSKYFLIKSWYYSVVLWFAFFAITVLFRIPELTILKPNEAIINFVAATIWGLGLGIVLRYLNAKSR